MSGAVGRSTNDLRRPIGGTLKSFAVVLRPRSAWSIIRPLPFGEISANDRTRIKDLACFMPIAWVIVRFETFDIAQSRIANTPLRAPMVLTMATARSSTNNVPASRILGACCGSFDDRA